MRLLPRVLTSIYSAKASHAQPHDTHLRSDTQALRLIASIPLIQRRKKHCFREEKAPSRSGFPLSMHVVLKTRHVNPNIHARRFIVHVRSPNLCATRPQFLSLRRATTSYKSRHKSYTAFLAILYSSTRRSYSTSIISYIRSGIPQQYMLLGVV